MKRCIATIHEESAHLTPSDVAELLQEVNTLYCEKTAACIAYFFATGLDVFITHILNPISHAEPIEWLVPLCRVNKLWHRLIHQLRHISISRRSSFEYDNILSRHFPLVTSLRSHRKILAIPFIPSFARVVHLEIDEPCDDDTRSFGYSVKGWTSLRTLKFRTSTNRVEGLRSLTQLTHLEIHAACFASIKPELRKLSNLRHLWIREFSPLLNLSCLPQLRHLESDRAHHFVDYTGTGVLDFDDDLSEAWEEERHARDRLAPACYQGTWTGEWKNGVFTGHAHYYYDTEESTAEYDGNMKDGKREGYGEETSLSDSTGMWTIYKGEWKNGVRHGNGSIYSRPHFGSLASTKLVSKGLWQNGQLMVTYVVYHT